MSKFAGTGFPPASKPRRVNGGIKAQSQRGAFGEHWWGKQWIDVLEGFGLGARLTRGRNYARRGQVIEIAIDPDGVRAKVQGSRKTPYAVTIQVKPLVAAQWRHVIEIVAKTPRFAAMLLNGEMPTDIEDAFRTARCGLFPQSVADLRTACSCPDWSNPCKHVAAVYYLIGEEFDRDPFLLFALRGLERGAMLQALSGAEPPPKRVVPVVRESRSAVPAASPASPTERPAVEPPPIDAWLLRRAGRLPFWHGNDSLEDALAGIYVKAGESAAAFLAETWGDSREMDLGT